ncbi:MAG: SDR family oxidoreductase [Deltaproteobacteria bacterium]|nr:SDR family oxidoreductase [Deltaproteobacteria bacterium]
MRLNDRVAIVTGGGQGIGRAYVERFLAEGATVVIAEIDESRGAATAAELASRGEVEFIFTDISDEASVAESAARAQERFGHIDILLNNAALYDRIDFSNQSLEYLRKVYDVNLHGAWLMSRAVAPFMVERRHGRIINVGSTMAYLYQDTGESGAFDGLDSYAYNLTKWGIIGLTRFMAEQLGPHGITVNCMAPGFTQSEASRKFLGPDGTHPNIQAIEAATPMAIGAFQPEDMTGTAVYFASDDARYVTGQLIVVDGGMIKPS